MNSPRLFAVLPWVAAVFLSAPACLSVPDIEPAPVEELDAGSTEGPGDEPTDAGPDEPTDGGLDEPTEEPATAEVRLISPQGTAHTNGVVEVRLDVTGDTPDRVELLVGGEVLAELVPPYTHAWDTSAVPEGTHRLSARVVIGDQTFTSEAQEVVVDRTPPQVVSRTPAPGAQDVWVRSPIQAVFSEPLKASTLTDTSVRLTVDGVVVARTVSMSMDRMTLTVEPVTSLKAPNSVTLSLTDELTDQAGNKLSVPAEQWDWSSPIWLPWGTGDGAFVTSSEHFWNYALSSSGDLFIAGRAVVSSSQRRLIKRWNGSTWQTMGIPLGEHTGNTSILGQSLVVDEAGNPIFAWSESLGEGAANIYVRRWRKDHWEQLGNPLSADPLLTNKRNPSLHMTSSGQIAIAWSESNSNKNQLCVSIWNEQTWLPAGTCHNLSNITSKPVVDSTLVLRITNSAIPTIAWTTDPIQTGYNSQMHVAQFISGQWHDYDSEPSSTSHHPYISMTVDLSGNPLIAWAPYNGSVYNIAACRGDGLFSWKFLDITLSEEPATTSTLGAHSIQIDRTGAPVVAWAQNNRLHVRRWNEEAWNSLDLPGSASISAIEPQALQRTQSGDLLMSWIETQGGTSNKYMRVRRLNQ